MVRDLATHPYLPLMASLDDDEDSVLDAVGTGDSHYELPVLNDDENDDSQFELPAFTSDDALSSDEIPVFAEDPPSEETLIVDPRHSHGGDARVRYRSAGIVATGAVSLAVVGYFLRQGVLSGRTISSLTPALIAVCFGLGGFVLLLYAMSRSPLHLLPGELAKNLHRPSARSNMDSQVVSE